MDNQEFDHVVKEYREVFKDNISVKFRSFESSDSKVKACIIYSEGMIIHDTVWWTIVEPIQSLHLPTNIKPNNVINYISSKVLSSEEVVLTSDKQKLIKSILSGDTVLLLADCTDSIIINTRGWETRTIDEPKGERTTKGPQEGFTEAAIVNITLIKRKITDPSLKFVPFSIGSITNTDVFISYIDSLVSKDILDELYVRIKKINIDAILDSNYVSECISENGFSGFETVGSTQRPDIAAAKLLEGKIAIIVNGSPDVLYVPYLFYENFLCNEDYYYNYLFAIFNRLIRLLAFFISSSISAIYLSYVCYHQQVLPKEVFMTIAVSREGIPFQTVVELILMLITFEIIREAGTRLSLNIGQAVSIVGAIVLGEAAVSAKLISAPIVIITALSGITSLMLPKLMHVLIYIRTFLLLISSLYGLYGYVFGVMMIVGYMMTIESFGINYMGFINNPSNKKMSEIIFRVPFMLNKDIAKNIVSKNDIENSE